MICKFISLLLSNPVSLVCIVMLIPFLVLFHTHLLAWIDSSTPFSLPALRRVYNCWCVCPELMTVKSSTLFSTICYCTVQQLWLPCSYHHGFSRLLQCCLDSTSYCMKNREWKIKRMLKRKLPFVPEWWWSPCEFSAIHLKKLAVLWPTTAFGKVWGKHVFVLHTRC